MQALAERKRLFVSGQLVELWEDPEIPFGWTQEDLAHYLARAAWVLLFNAVALTAAAPAPAHGS